MTEHYIILTISALAAVLAVLSSYQLVQHYQLCAYHIGEYYKNIKIPDFKAGAGEFNYICHNL